MTDIGPLVKLLQEQIDKQEDRHREQMEAQKEQMEAQKEQMEAQKEQMEAQKEQMEAQRKQMDMQRLDFAKQMDALINRLGTGSLAPAAPAASCENYLAFIWLARVN